ncbi:SprT-like domain-containing protein [Neisseria sp. Ec49-e6-T10]|uniref:SprT-like domain-containing protein n=1 Tax=Neisseria sp. Ec49-e6-T10 TaxID=3140744 RepID=UPI003EC0A116
MAHELYEQLQQAYDYFNQVLFAGRLPNCLITVQRENENVHGYFSHKRFGSKDQKTKQIDEIAMNPIYFVNTRIENVLSTLVHEMVHLEQAHFGEPGRARYHNRQWGEWMERVGLMASNTGKKNGRKTGDQMTHYIIQNGPFDLACKKLINKQFQITWYDQKIHSSPSFIQQIAIEPVNYGDHISVSRLLGKNTEGDPDFPSDQDDPTAVNEPEAIIRLKQKIERDLDPKPKYRPETPSDDDIVEPIEKPVDKKKKTTYQCPNCKVKVWGRPALDLHCNSCETDFIEVD